MSAWQTLQQIPRRAYEWLAGRGRNFMDAVTGTDNRVPWPPESEAARLQGYERRQALYEGRHAEVFAEDAAKLKDGNSPYIVVNYSASATDRLSWRLFGEGIEVKAPEEQPGTTDFLQHLYTRNSRQLRDLEQAIEASYRGDYCYKVRYDAREQRIVIETVDPSLVTYTTDPLNTAQTTSVTISQVLQQGEDAYLWQERNELRDEGGRYAGWIVNEAYRLTKDERGRMVYDPARDRVPLERVEALKGRVVDEQYTGVDALLVIPCWGKSDYASVESLQGEINNRYSRRKRVLDVHANPKMYGPELSDDYGKVDIASLEYIPFQPHSEAAPIGMVVWDAQMTAVETAIRDATNAFAATVGIDMAALIPPESGGPISGRALRLSQTTTQATVQGKQLSHGDTIRRVYSVATKLATAPGVVLAFTPSEGSIVALEPEDVTVTWQDGLPPDRYEDVEEEVMRVREGIQSVKAALMKLDGLNEEDAQAKADEIAGATRAAQTPPNAGALNLQTGNSSFRQALSEAATQGAQGQPLGG